MDLIHNYGSWTPVRFVPAAFMDGPPAYFVTTSRICRGAHDLRCHHSQTVTFGPLVAAGTELHEAYVCPRCRREQPPVQGPGEVPLCLSCSDASTVINVGDARDTTAAMSALAALHSASTTLAQFTAIEAESTLLASTGESLRHLLELMAQDIKEDPARAGYVFNRLMVRLARQILLNAREYGTEQYPVKEIDEEL